MSDKKKFGGNLKITDRGGEEACCESGDSCCGPSEKQRNKTIKTLSVFDPAMCCSTGVCGPKVDPVLVRFAADLKWLESQGVSVERFNLAQSPKVFVENDVVRSQLETKGEAALPLVCVDGKVVAIGAYPSREELIGFIGLSSDVESLFTPLVAELVAIGAAVAANCDSCLRYHIKAAKGMGVSEADITLAIEMAVKVKGVSHSIVMGVAERLTQPEKDEVEPSDAS